ncbi:MAG: hypothetical protein K6B65_05675 [Bacilli bacterium]|nr:hypothetical protein [Bacilli bacterium]
MKYSSTPRLLNAVVFALLFVGFAVLALFFTFFYLPFLWSGLGSGPIENSLSDVSVALVAMIGSLGVAGAFISCIGLIRSIKALMNGKDDELVRRSFDCYFSLGYVLAAVLFLNATWLIRLTTANFGDVSMGFVIAVYIIALILVLVGTNIPLVKIYEDDQEGKSMARVLLLASLSIGVGVAVSFLYAGIVTLALGAGISGQSTLLLKYFTLAIAPALGGIVAALGMFLSKKGNDKGSSIALYSSLGIYGLGIMYCGLLSVLFNNTTKDKFIFMEQTLSAHPTNWLVNTVLGFVIGGLILIGAIALVVITVMPKKDKKTAR